VSVAERAAAWDEPLVGWRCQITNRTKGLVVDSIALPVTIELELRPEGADIGSLERAVSAGLVEAGRLLWTDIVTRLESRLPVPVGCRACGGYLSANGRAPRRLVTLAGEVELLRRRYRCRECAAETVPLDEALGLEPRIQHTLGVVERGLWLVTETSFERASRTLEELRGIPISRGRLHRLVQEEGARLEAEARARTEAVLGDHPDRREATPIAGDVWVQADGTMVHDRASGTHVEVQVGLVFTGTEQVGRDRRRLVDRHLVGATGSWTTFAERLVTACAELGVYGADRILFVSDGALQIRWIRERAFPDAIELLDWYHLVEQLDFGIGHRHADVLSTATGAAIPGDVDALLAILRAHAGRMDIEDPEQATRCRAVIGYVANNRTGIRNYRIVPLASSGPMEKACDIVVCRRFKTRGMSWFRRGVSHLLQLRLLRLNGGWGRYWAGRSAERLRPWPSPVAA
jgi:hypothetical protein